MRVETAVPEDAEIAEFAETLAVWGVAVAVEGQVDVVASPKLVGKPHDHPLAEQQRKLACNLMLAGSS